VVIAIRFSSYYRVLTVRARHKCEVQASIALVPLLIAASLPSNHIAFLATRGIPSTLHRWQNQREVPSNACICKVSMLHSRLVVTFCAYGPVQQGCDYRIVNEAQVAVHSKSTLGSVLSSIQQAANRVQLSSRLPSLSAAEWQVYDRHDFKTGSLGLDLYSTGLEPAYQIKDVIDMAITFAKDEVSDFPTTFLLGSAVAIFTSFCAARTTSQRYCALCRCFQRLIRWPGASRASGEFYHAAHSTWLCT
jgi:hypothetical protein